MHKGSNDKDLRPEYPEELIESGARGKYAKRYREEGTNIVRIDSELRLDFADSASVNRVLRDYLAKK